jgi:hypothetical protein
MNCITGRDVSGDCAANPKNFISGMAGDNKNGIAHKDTLCNSAAIFAASNGFTVAMTPGFTKSPE